MASALLDELKTVTNKVKLHHLEYVVGTSIAALAAEESTQGRERHPTGQSEGRRTRGAK